MNRGKGKCTGEPFCSRKRLNFLLQTPHEWKQRCLSARRRVSLCAFQRGSLTLETALALPLLLCAVTALLYIYAFTAGQAEESRKLMERAELLAVTVGQGDTEDPYIRLWAPSTAELPFLGGMFGGRLVMQKAVVRAWSGYTGESFRQSAPEELVYLTPEGTVCHQSRDCTYLRLTIRTLPASELEGARNQSGGRYEPCAYCAGSPGTGAIVYITDYGTSYHRQAGCQGLKRTVMVLPRSEAGGRPLCSRCGGS